MPFLSSFHRRERMILLPLLLAGIQQIHFEHTLAKGVDQKQKSEKTIVVSQESKLRPWRKVEEGPTYLLITADPFATKLVYNYSDISISTMRTLEKLIQATVLEIKRNPSKAGKDAKWNEAITQLNKIVSNSDPKKFRDSIKLIREFALKPSWPTPPKGLSKMRKETTDAWKHFADLIESLWGSLESGDEGWFLALSRVNNANHRAPKGRPVVQGEKRALLPRIGDALYFDRRMNPLPKWGGLEPFGKNGCVHSPKVLKRVLKELAGHIIASEPSFEVQQRASRYSLWNLLLMELDDPELNLIKERLGGLGAEKWIIKKMLEARIQSVLGQTVIMRDVARRSLVFGHLAGAIRTPFNIYCLLLISGKVEKALSDAVDSLKHSVEMGKRVVSAMKKIKGARLELDDLAFEWDLLDGALLSFKEYLRKIQKIRKLDRGDPWKPVNKGSSIPPSIESIALFSFDPMRPDVLSDLGGRATNDAVSPAIPRKSWLWSLFKVDALPHDLRIKLTHNGHHVFWRTGIPKVAVKGSDGKFADVLGLWGWGLK